MQIYISRLTLLLAVLFFTFNSYARMGTSDGGGGVGVRCPSNVSPIAFELLDIHEIKLEGKVISHNLQNEAEAIQLASKNLGLHYYNPSSISPNQYIDYLKSNFVQSIFNGEAFYNPIVDELTQVEFVDSLPLSNDIGDYSVKPGCSLEQVAYYFDDSNTLKIVSTKWNELSWLDKSALVSHEVHYFLDRFNGIEDFASQHLKTSERVRRFTGLLYSTERVTPKYSISPKSGYYRCESNVDSEIRDTSFRVHSTGHNEFTAVFASAQGYSSAYQTVAVFDGVPLDALLAWPEGEFVIEKPLVVLTDEVIPNFSVRISKTWGRYPTLQVFMNKDGVKIPVASEEEILCWNPELN